MIAKINKELNKDKINKYFRLYLMNIERLNVLRNSGILNPDESHNTKVQIKKKYICKQ